MKLYVIISYLEYLDLFDLITLYNMNIRFNFSEIGFSNHLFKGLYSSYFASDVYDEIRPFGPGL